MKQSKFLDSVRVKTNEECQVYIAVDSSNKDIVQYRWALTKQQALDKENITKVCIRFLRWNFAQKSYIQQRSNIINKETGNREFSRQAYNEYKLRILLTGIIPDGEENIIKREMMGAEGHKEISKEDFAIITELKPEFVNVMLYQMERVLDNGESPEYVNKSILEGEETLDLSTTIYHLLEAFSIPDAKIVDAMKTLSEGCLKDYFPKKVGNLEKKPDQIPSELPTT